MLSHRLHNYSKKLSVAHDGTPVQPGEVELRKCCEIEEMTEKNFCFVFASSSSFMGVHQINQELLDVLRSFVARLFLVVLLLQDSFLLDEIAHTFSRPVHNVLLPQHLLPHCVAKHYGFGQSCLLHVLLHVSAGHCLSETATVFSNIYEVEFLSERISY